MKRIVFSGHMIDAPDRKNPRFPASAEKKVRQTIKARLESMSDVSGAIAGGACGGDIIFHEICLELGIPAVLFLPLSPGEFKEHSVSFAGSNWVDRFDQLVRILPIQHPRRRSTAVWENANEEMLNIALHSGDQTKVLVLLNTFHDGQAGGSAHMVGIARHYHIEPEIIDLNLLL